jgi:hypothetical protein
VITNAKKYEEFERELIRSRKANYWENVRIVEALYREAVLLGIFPLKDPLEGLQVDIGMARVINGVRKSS